MRQGVEDELDRLVAESTLEPIEYSDWAAPIVAVLKPDKTVRICGDFRTTVNPVSKLHRYPIPRVEDLFASLVQGQTFTTIDLKQAYQQMKLDPQSRKYLVINTHRGLFRYTRLPYGVSSAPGLFQKAMEQLLRGIPGVAVYIDDILVTDPSLPIVLACDASQYGIGAVLAHKMPDGSERPIGYVSRTLNDAEKNYAQLEKEGLSLIFGVKKFYSYLFGHHFTLVSDHKPRTGATNNTPGEFPSFS